MRVARTHLVYLEVLALRVAADAKLLEESLAWMQRQGKREESTHREASLLPAGAAQRAIVDVTDE
jgi:hypothetical protein